VFGLVNILKNVNDKMLDYKKVGLVKEECVYNNIPPFHPSEIYPEFKDSLISDFDNPAYRGVRKVLHLLGLDNENYGRENWNPLKEMIKKNDTVVIKPNLVHHINMNRDVKDLPLDSLITHASFIRVVLDYAAKAMDYEGRILIGDAPIQGADFEKIIDITGINEIIEYFSKKHKNIKLEIADFRLAKSVLKNGNQIERIKTNNSIEDYEEVDIGENSLLIPLMKNKYKFGVAQYSYKKMVYAHNKNSNKYLFPKKVLNADVIINLPKLKFHKRAGITCAMKNLVGIIGHKDYLPHFRYGSPKNGGDEYPDGGFLWDMRWFFEHREWEKEKGLVKKIYYKCVYLMRGIMRKGFNYPDDFDHTGSGGWHGNDTLWRTVLDINRAFYYFNRKTNKLEDYTDNSKKCFTIVDGIIGGEKNSPLAPSPAKSGVILASYNPLALDSVATSVVGFDTKKIKQISEAYKIKDLKLCNFKEEEIEVQSDTGISSIRDIHESNMFKSFVPSKGFLNYIEYNKTGEKD
jgi:uncharacterized protein (DUF362 family)